MRRPYRARIAARERAVLLLVALVILAALATSAAHQIAVPHRLCQLHGTIEHGSPEALAAHEDAHGAMRGPKVVPGAGPHEECEIAAFTRHDEFAPLDASPCVGLVLEPRGFCELLASADVSTRPPREPRGRSPPA